MYSCCAAWLEAEVVSDTEHVSCKRVGGRGATHVHVVSRKVASRSPWRPVVRRRRQCHYGAVLKLHVLWPPLAWSQWLLCEPWRILRRPLAVRETLQHLLLVQLLLVNSEMNGQCSICSTRAALLSLPLLLS